ncbi:LysR family transcriptional regulator [Rhizobium sp. XQZ8]|uniref:LysR family transcriptional regulator n=1 Tax=Rhizobium populisoli TaxID=2859785 RepID=UPI001C683312|nr:LysR family transcriptional regulator [Rhizobium populisoli]MBW6422170.1 LysR family transcriptional regulator [Rhizobium populisoli]
MNNVKPTDLSSFLVVARQASFRRAADELGVTPSALSHTIRNIEERLGLRLLNRTTRSVALTEAGQRLFDRLQPAFRDIDDALDDLNALRGRPVGSLRLNASRISAQLLLLPVVTEFLRENPEVQVEIVVDDGFVDMVSGGFDAGIRFGESVAKDMIAVPIGPRQRSAVIASPAFFEKYPKPQVPGDLIALPCIRYRFASGRYYAWEFEKDEAELAVEVDGPLTLGDQILMVDAALQDVGLAYVFEAQVAGHIAAGRLVRVLEDWCPPYPGLHIYYPSRRQMPAPLRAFLDHIRKS